MNKKVMRRSNINGTSNNENSNYGINDEYQSLPKWLFDVEMEDEYQGNFSSLLDELEIDPSQIYK